MFERGYKTWCEKYAAACRKAANLAAHDPLDMRVVAEQLKVRVWTPNDVPGLSHQAVEILLRNDGVTPSCWSALTLIVGSKTLIILNSSHSPARQQSDLAHELAHMIRGHTAEEVSVSEDGLMLLKSYEKQFEEEADWLAGCLLLPRDALVHIKRSGISEQVALAAYGVSQRMLSYRMARTAVDKQPLRAA